MEKKVSNIAIGGAKIVFRNFRGLEGKFNPAGRRNFCVLLDNDLAEQLLQDGWNVRYFAPREEGEAPQAYMQVGVSYSNKPPKIWMVTSRGKTLLDEESVGALDWAEIVNIDMTINPYPWNVSGKSGIKAYLKSMYVTIAEDEFEAKYADSDDCPF